MAIKYVRATGGSDANNGSTFALGWTSLAWAFNASNPTRTAPGDTLAVCGDISSNIFTFTATLYLQPAAPSETNPIYFVGYSMLGIPLTNGNFVKITTSVALAEGLIRVLSSFFKFSNIYFDGGGSGKASSTFVSLSRGFINLTFTNCRFTNCSSYGLNLEMPTGLGTVWKFLQCEIDNNGKGGTAGGFYSIYDDEGSYYMEGCKIHDNNGPGITMGDVGIFINNLIYKNTGDGLIYTNNGGSSPYIGLILKNNVFFGNSGDGLDIHATAYPKVIVNNIFRSNGQYGIRTNSADIDALNFALFSNNCSHNNTSGHIDVNGGVLLGLGNITSDPLFVSEVAGHENFTLQSTSPCLNAGYNPLV